MILRPEASPLSKDGILQLFGTALCYFIPLILLNALITTTFGAELRLSSFIPVVAGLLFGLPAAIGSFLGNFCSCYYIGYDLIPSLILSVLYFLLAYTPYRLWYGWQSKNATLYIYNNHTFVKYFAINFLSGSSFASICYPFQEFFFENISPSVTLLNFVDYFVFPTLFGYPVIFLWNKYAKVKYYRPQEQQQNWQKLCSHALCFLCLMDIICISYIKTGFFSMNRALTLGGCSTLIWLYAIQLPSSYTTTPDEMNNFQSLSISFGIRIFAGMGLPIFFFLSFFIYSQGFSVSTWRNLQQWIEFGTKSLVFLLLLTFFSHQLQRSIERNVTNRLNNFISRVKAYLNTHDLNKLQTDYAISTQHQDEIDILEQVIHKKSKELIAYLEKLDSVTAEQMTFNTDLKIANFIQQGELPDLSLLRPKLHGYRIDGGMAAAKIVGGDMYDAFLLDDDHLLIFISDVSGKGVSAAVFPYLLIRS